MSNLINEKEFDDASMSLLLNCSHVLNEEEIHTRLGNVIRGKTGTLHRFLSDTDHLGLMIDCYLEAGDTALKICIRNKNDIVKKWNQADKMASAEAIALFQKLYDQKSSRKKFRLFGR